jgi:flavodoxin
MSNVSVVYATKTRHSGKLAEQIAKEFGITAKDVEKYPEPEDADLLFWSEVFMQERAILHFYPMLKSLMLP